MISYIVVHGGGKTVKVATRKNGTINDLTLRSAFLLRDDVPIELFRNGRTLECRNEGNECVFTLGSEWMEADFELGWEDARRSRPNRSIEIEKNASKSKKPRIEPEIKNLPVDGDLAASVARYALYYVKNDSYKRCAVPLTTRLAAIYRHGENKSIKIGDEIVVRSWSDKEFKISTRVVKIIEHHDTIILQSDNADLCDRDLIFDSGEVSKGKQYLLSLSTGIITSDLTRRIRFMGSSGGSFEFDSGGSCWNENGKLMGMQVELLKGPTSSASGDRCCIIASRDILGSIQDLLPESDGSVEWNE